MRSARGPREAALLPITFSPFQPCVPVEVRYISQFENFDTLNPHHPLTGCQDNTESDHVPGEYPSPHENPLSIVPDSCLKPASKLFQDPRQQKENRLAQSLLAVNEITTYRWSFVEDVLGYHDAGVRTMGVWRPKLEEYGEERAIDLVHETKMSVSSVSWAGCFTGQNGYPYTESVRDAKDTLRLGGDLNADCVIMLSGGLSGHIFKHAKRLFVDALKELGDFAGECRVKMAVQPMQRLFAHDWTFVTSIDETLDVIDACNHEMVGMAFDVYHLWQEPNLLGRIAEIAPLVSTVQLNDYHRPPTSEYDRGLIGDGVIPLSEITRTFLENGYAGRFEIAIWSEELWKSNYDRLLEDCRARFENLLAPCVS